MGYMIKTKNSLRPAAVSVGTMDFRDDIRYLVTAPSDLFGISEGGKRGAGSTYRCDPGWSLARFSVTRLHRHPLLQ